MPSHGARMGLRFAYFGIAMLFLYQAHAAQNSATLSQMNGSPTSITLVSNPQQEGVAWVYAPQPAAAQQQPDQLATSTGSTATGPTMQGPTTWSPTPGSPGRWRRARHWHNYPRPPPTAPGAANLLQQPGTSMPAGTAWAPQTAGQPAPTPAYIPGKGWATIVWAPGAPGSAPVPPDPQPAAWQAPAAVTEPGAGPTGPSGSKPKLPEGTTPSGWPNMSPSPSPVPAAGPWAGGSSGGSWGSSSSGAGRPGWPSPAGSDWDEGDADDDNDKSSDDIPKWPWMKASPSPGSSGRPGSDSNRDRDDDEDDDTPRRPPWAGAGPGPNRPGPWSTPSGGIGRASPSPSPSAGLGFRPSSPRPGSSMGGSTVPMSSGMWAASPRPSPSPKPSWGSGPGLTGPGPSRADPDKPWSWMRGSPSPSPSAGWPGLAGTIWPPAATLPTGLRASPTPSPSPAGLGPGSTMPRSSPTPISSSSSSSLLGSEWDEGEGEGDNEGDWLLPKQSPRAGMGSSPRPAASPSMASPRPGAASSPAPGGAAAGGRPGGSASPRPAIEPATGLSMLAPRASPSTAPRIGVGAVPGATGAVPLTDEEPVEDIDVEINIDESAPKDDNLNPAPSGPAAGQPGSSSGVPSAATSPPRPGLGSLSPPRPGASNTSATAAAGGPGQQPPKGPATGPGPLMPGRPGASMGPGPQPGGVPGGLPGGMMGPGKPGTPSAAPTAAATAATAGNATAGMGILAPANTRNGSGGVLEAGARAGAATAPPPAAPGFTLRPAINQGAGGGVGMAGQPAMALGANSSLFKGPEPYVIKQSGAQETILIGCALPFEGSDQDSVGKAVHVALKMALQDLVPKMKPPVNVNLTCLNSRCLDIPAYNAMSVLAKEGAVAVIGEICSAATVAAAGVAAAKEVPLISPASSSPQLTNMPFFFRTVPSDRYQGAAAAEFALKKGLKTIGMVYEDASYGYGLAFNFIATFTRDGGSIPIVESFKKGAGDPQRIVAKMVEAKASKKLEAVYVSTNNLTFFADFVRAADKAKLDLLILGGDAIASPFITDAFKDNPGLLKGVTITAFNQGSDDFQAKFKAAAPGVEYDGNAAQGYDAMTALLNAYSSTPSPREPRAIAKAIPKQNFIGVSGAIAFDSKGDMLPNNDTYVQVKFDAKTGAQQMGPSIPLRSG